MIAAAVAAALNRCIPPDLRRRLQSHAGATIALHFFGARMCFRIGENGEWRAASSLIDADAEMKWSANGDAHISGGGALLRELDEVRKCCAPRERAEDIFGAAGAEKLYRAAQTANAFLQDIPARCGAVAAPDATADFFRDVAAFESAVSAAAARVSSLEARR